MIPIEDFLLESAPLARRLAPSLCRRDHVTGKDCAWIHGLWQYLRLLGLASTPDYHRPFFAQALRTVAAPTGTPRILVSGAADYAMFALVAGAFREDTVRPAITVVDQCETPLMLTRWYAERAALEVTTRRSDLFEFSGNHAFDALCTHSLLSEFPTERRPAILARWQHLLRPGGAAIVANRLRPGCKPGPLHATPGQAQAFGAAVLQSARVFGASLSCDPVELAQDAQSYMSRRVTYAVQQDEIVSLFENAGFTIRQIACGPLVAPVRHDVTGLTTPGGAEYACIVATTA